MKAADEPQQPAEGEAVPDDGQKSVDEWARALYPARDSGLQHADAWKHGAASALHGWALHVLHGNEQMRLSREDYEAAIRAATELKDGGYTPHPAALSQYVQQPQPQPEKEG